MTDENYKHNHTQNSYTDNWWELQAYPYTEDKAKHVRSSFITEIVTTN